MSFIDRIKNVLNNFKIKKETDIPTAEQLNGEDFEIEPIKKEVSEETAREGKEEVIEKEAPADGEGNEIVTPNRNKFEQDENVEDGIIQSYEEYSEVDDSIMNIFDDNTEEEKIRLDKDVEKFADITNENIEVKAKLKALDSMGKDIDEELMALLEKDEEKNNLMNSTDDVEVDFINKVTVFDTVERQKNAESQEILIEQGASGDQMVPILLGDDEEPARDLTLIIFLGICGVLSLLIIIVTIVIVVAFNKPKPTIEKNTASSQVIVQPQQISNSANFIYINAVSQLNDENISLQKMVMDSLATVFYFDKKLDVTNYNITLADNFGNMYEMDYSFYPFNGTSEEQRTVLNFKPFDKKIQQFTLSILDPKTTSEAEFSFEIDNYSIPTAKYVHSDEDVLTDIDNVTGIVQSAQFSTTGSSVHFRFNWEDAGESIVFGNESNNSADKFSVSLKQVSTILPTKIEPNLYVFKDENLAMGRMDFAPLKKLSGNISITFKGLMKKYAINKEINIKELLFNKEDSNIIINIGNYDLCLDRVIYDVNKFDKIVLVVHAEDRRIPKNTDSSDAELDNRVEVVLDVQLIAVGYGGVEIPFDGIIFSRKEGSDIVFNVSNAKNFLKGMNTNDFKIAIKSAAIKMDDVTATLNLDDAATKESKEDILFEQKLVEAFESRLAYKSGKFGLTNISGFSGEVMDDAGLLRNYTPMENSQEAVFSAQVMTYFANKENQMTAIVQEIWKDNSDGAKGYLYRTHRVICDFDGTNLTIVSDVIQN